MFKFAKKFMTTVLGLSMLLGAVSPASPIGLRTAFAEGETINIKDYGSYKEGVHAEWDPVTGADGYIVYYKNNTEGSEWQKADDELIRQYAEGWRIDVPGLSKGEWRIKVEAGNTGSGSFVQLASKSTPEITVKACDRTGFASPLGNGAYTSSGSLKDDADVVYITQTNKNTVSFTPGGEEASKTYTGLADIINNYLPAAKRPLDIRIIGMVTGGGDFKKYADWKGDLYVSNANAVTIEGIGEDAVAYGWGIKTSKSSDVEIRNLGFMNTSTTRGNSVELSGEHIFVHNCDFFYGAVSGAAISCRKADNVTLSYNHFYDNESSIELGTKDTFDEVGMHASVHHNWFDHSDAANPLVRGYSAHVYNNFFSGNSKYGLAASMNASVFLQNNYFSGTSYPMLISGQGHASGVLTDVGGIIKATGNKNSGGLCTFYGEDEGMSLTEFDAVNITTASAIVAATIKTKNGGYIYNNFDSSEQMYSYEVNTALETPILLKLGNGRVGGGDLSWEFSSKDNTSSTPNAELKKLIDEYESPVYSVGGINSIKSAETYLVKFNSAGGSYVPDMKIAAGEVTTLDQTPTYEGYSFLGWYTKPENGEEVRILDGSSIESNITLYAHWGEKHEPEPEKETVKVSFVYEDGTPVDNIETQSVEIGGLVLKPADPVLSNATFLGWYLENSAWDFENGHVITDITLVARFMEEERFFILLEDENGIAKENVILEYTKEARTPVVSVCYGTLKNYKKLSEGIDYTVSYKNNKTWSHYRNFYASGTYDETHPEYEKTLADPSKQPCAIIKFKGNYAGTIVKEFGIAKRVYEKKDNPTYSIKGGSALLYLDSSDGAAPVEEVAYQGSPVKFESIKLSLPGEAGEISGGMVEAVGSDQFSVSYKKNISKGTATVFISGTGDLFEGTIKKNFKIVPADIKKAEGFTSLELGYCYASYAKAGAKPALSLTFGPQNLLLKEGKDYTLVCRDNKAVTDEDGLALGKKPTVTIKGKGNFSGEATFSFKIMQADLSTMKISVPDVVFSDAKGKFASKVTVTENITKGKKLAEKKDYNLEYFLCDSDGITLSEIPLDRKEGRVSQPCYVMAKLTPASEFYTGEAEIIYSCTKPESMINKGIFVINDKVWEGENVVLEAKDFTVSTLNGTKLNYGEDYEIVPGSYQKNDAKGKASVTIRGKGKYSGLKVLKFNILPRNM